MCWQLVTNRIRWWKQWKMKLIFCCGAHLCLTDIHTLTSTKLQHISLVFILNFVVLGCKFCPVQHIHFQSILFCPSSSWATFIPFYCNASFGKRLFSVDVLKPILLAVSDLSCCIFLIHFVTNDSVFVCPVLWGPGRVWESAFVLPPLVSLLFCSVNSPELASVTECGLASDIVEY